MWPIPLSKRVTLMFPSKELLMAFLDQVFTHDFEVSAKKLSITAYFSEEEIILAKVKFHAFITDDNMSS